MCSRQCLKHFAHGAYNIFCLHRRGTSAENSVQSFTYEFYAREGKKQFFVIKFSEELMIYILAKLNNILSLGNVMPAFYAFFQSIATYGITSWGATYCNSIDKLHKLQNKLFKIISNNKDNNNGILKTPINIQQSYLFNR